MKISPLIICVITLGATGVIFSCAGGGSKATAPHPANVAPVTAQEADRQGGKRVKIRFDVTPEGEVANTQVPSSPDPTASEKALEAIRAMKFPNKRLSLRSRPKVTFTTTIVVTDKPITRSASGRAALR